MKKAIVTIDQDVVLKIENLSIAFGGLKAVDDLSFEIKKNEIFGLIGPNGAGKTTVFNCITQFYQPNQGHVYLRSKENNSLSIFGKLLLKISKFNYRIYEPIKKYLNAYEEDEIVDLVGKKTHNIIRLGIVRTFQNLELIRELSVIDNVLIGGHIHFKTGFISHSLKTPRAVKEERRLRIKALEILRFLELEPLKDALVSGLPYGILKKVELARTLMSDPKLIILDEPAAGLNDHESEKLTETIRIIRDKYHCSILLVEHDMKLVMDVCDRICAISFGKKLIVGTPNEVQNNKDVQEAYLGKDED